MRRRAGRSCLPPQLAAHPPLTGPAGCNVRLLRVLLQPARPLLSFAVRPRPRRRCVPQFQKRLRLVSDKHEGPTAGTHDFEPLEFLALLLPHVPDYHEILVRYSGAYSVRRRALWRQLGILSDTRMRAEPAAAAKDVTPAWPALRALRRRWRCQSPGQRQAQALRSVRVQTLRTSIAPKVPWQSGLTAPSYLAILAS